MMPNDTKLKISRDTKPQTRRTIQFYNNNKKKKQDSSANCPLVIFFLVDIFIPLFRRLQFF
jgi:hypothetical protein